MDSSNHLKEYLLNNNKITNSIEFKHYGSYKMNRYKMKKYQ